METGLLSLIGMYMLVALLTISENAAQSEVIFLH